MCIFYHIKFLVYIDIKSKQWIETFFSNLDEVIEETEGNNYRATPDVVLLPPSINSFASDKEERDDDNGLAQFASKCEWCHWNWQWWLIWWY